MKNYRPGYHFCPKKNWINDPCGLIEHAGVYHMYFQHNPNGDIWGDMHWGHATSRDMIDWHEEPIALAPDAANGEAHCFTGSAYHMPDGRAAFIYTSISEKRRPEQWHAWAADDGLGKLVQTADHALTMDMHDAALELTEWRDPNVLRRGDGYLLVTGGCIRHADGRRGGAALLYTGALQIKAGAMASGDVIALVNYMNQILIELVKLANLIVQVSKALACAGRVQAVLDTKPGMQFPASLQGEVSADKAGDAVRFDHVTLTYAGAGAPSLTDISFTAKQGQTIGVIGGTGSGKSSLISLIPRFYDATGGQVEIFGRPAAAYPRQQLRSMVSVVMQRAQLFEGTIRSNLLWGRKDATDAELWEALETAQAAEFVRSKPLGLDEPVEQGGRNLSGGQKQRLTIARALVGKPRVLILDDSASALDYATDAALRKALAALPGGMTVFIVSQRAASLQHADQILVLDDGHMVGLGTHAQLLDSCPVYQEIYASQFKKGGAQ